MAPTWTNGETTAGAAARLHSVHLFCYKKLLNKTRHNVFFSTGILEGLSSVSLAVCYVVLVFLMFSFVFASISLMKFKKIQALVKFYLFLTRKF